MGIQTPKETNHEKKNISNTDIEKFWVFFLCKVKILMNNF